MNTQSLQIALWIIVSVASMILATSWGISAILASNNESQSDESSLEADTHLRIDIQQTDSQLRASAGRNILSDWQYIGPQARQDCQLSTFQWSDLPIHYGRVVNLSPSAENHYYCFRALDENQGYIYQPYLVTVFQPQITIRQHWQTDQNKAILLADSHREVQEWQITGYQLDPTCDQRSFSGISESFITANNLIELDLAELQSSADFDIYYCFRALGNDGQWYYQAKQPQIRKPVIDWRLGVDQLSVEIKDLILANDGQYIITDSPREECFWPAFLNNFSTYNGLSMSLPTSEGENFSYCLRVLGADGNYYYSQFDF